MYDRISNRLKHNSNLIYSCLWWVITFSSLYAYYIFFYYLGQPNLLNEELLCKVKDMIRNSALEKLKSFKANAMVKKEGYYWKIRTIRTFICEKMITFQKRISNAIEDDDISIDLALTMDQTPLSYVTPGKYIFNPFGAK